MSFVCSLDDLLQKNVIIFFFQNQISKWRSFEKGLFLTYFSHVLVTRESSKHSFSINLTLYFAHPVGFFALPILKKKNTNSSGMVSLWCDSLC